MQLQYVSRLRTCQYPSLTCVSDQVNQTYACENDRTLNQLLKDEGAFQGYVMSDWGAHHSTLAAVAGLDVSL